MESSVKEDAPNDYVCYLSINSYFHFNIKILKKIEIFKNIEYNFCFFCKYYISLLKTGALHDCYIKGYADYPGFNCLNGMFINT